MRVDEPRLHDGHLMPKRASEAAIAHMEQLVAYHKDPTKAPHNNPPRPPSQEVAWELTASMAQIMAVLLDRMLTGEIHPDNPCPEAVLAAGELMEKSLDGNLTPSDCEAVARRFGWKGDSDAGP